MADETEVLDRAYFFPARTIGRYPSETDLVEAGRLLLQAMDEIEINTGDFAVLRKVKDES